MATKKRNDCSNGRALPDVEDLLILGGFKEGPGGFSRPGGGARTYQTEVAGEFYLFTSPDAVAFVRQGDTVLVEHTSGPTGNALHLVSLSGVRVLRWLQILPGFQIQISTESKSTSEHCNDYNTFRVAMDEPSFRVIGIHRGIVRYADGRINTDPFHRPSSAVELARKEGLL